MNVTALRAEAMPHHAECEQQVLGAALLNPEILPEIIRKGGAGLFFDPVHVRIFDVMQRKDAAGELVSPVTVSGAMMADDGLAELGGGRYIVRLAGGCVSGTTVMSLVAMLADLRAKRDLAQALQDAQAAIAKGEEPAANIAARLEASLVASEMSGGGKGPVTMRAAVARAMTQITAAVQGQDDGAVRSGLPSLDHIVPGFYPGELILLGGRPSMGKTAVALSFALNVARAGHGVVIASLEMTPESMAMRALSEQTAQLGNAVSYSDMRRGDVDQRGGDAIMRAATELEKHNTIFLPTEYRDIGALFAGAKQAKRIMGGNLRLVVVDYLQLLRSKAPNRYEQITEISIALKAMAQHLNVPVLALSQLSRAVEQRDDKRPIMADLRESGQLEQDADTILFCYRDEYYVERMRPTEDDDADDHIQWQEAMERAKNRLEVIVAKQRQGEIGTAHMMFSAAHNTIWEA